MAPERFDHELLSSVLGVLSVLRRYHGDDVLLMAAVAVARHPSYLYSQRPATQSMHSRTVETSG